MADKGLGSSGDWTAGIVAIVAALLLGSALPIGLYFGLYKPKVAERKAGEEKKKKLNADMEVMIARQEKVAELEAEGKEMAKRVKEIEKPFAVADTEKMDVPDVRAALLRLAEVHNLALLPERKGELGSEIVYTGKQRIAFEHGLMATKLVIEALAFYHDFGRFVTDMETMEKYVIIPETVVCMGNTNGGGRHLFRMGVYVIEKRDVESIGR